MPIPRPIPGPIPRPIPRPFPRHIPEPILRPFPRPIPRSISKPILRPILRAIWAKQSEKSQPDHFFSINNLCINEPPIITTINQSPHYRLLQNSLAVIHYVFRWNVTLLATHVMCVIEPLKCNREHNNRWKQFLRLFSSEIKDKIEKKKTEKK